MLLEQIVDDPTEISRDELQKRILTHFSGEDRTQAILEYSAVFRNHRHGRWVRNLRLKSDSKDIVTAVEEWSLMKDTTQPSVFYRFGGAGCELDGVGIRKIHVYVNEVNQEKINVGSVCAQKIDEKNIFGDVERRGPSARSDRREMWDVDLLSIVDWLSSGLFTGRIPSEVNGLVEKLVNNGKISERENDVLVNFYNTTRQFFPSQLVGERDLITLRSTLGKFRVILPTEFQDMLFRNDLVTRRTADPLLEFVYDDQSSLLDRIMDDKDSRRTIRLERARVEFMIPDINNMCDVVLRYINDYEQVNSNIRHGMTSLVLPMQLYQSGFLMTEEDAGEVKQAFENKKNYSFEQLELERDSRFQGRRGAKWTSLVRRADKRDLVKDYLSYLNGEIKNSSLSDDMWRVINGVVKSKVMGSHTGYKTRAQMLAYHGSAYYLEKNLKDFLAAGYVGREFVLSDKLFYPSGQENNFPETFMGGFPMYAIPQAIRRVAYDDAQKLRNPASASKVLATRRIALDSLQETVMESLRRYNFR